MARFLGTSYKVLLSGCVGLALALAAQSASAQHHGGHHMGSSMHHGGSYSGHSGHHHHHSSFGGLYLGGMGGYGGFGGIGLGYGGYGSSLGYSSLYRGMSYSGLGYSGLGYSGLGYGGIGYSRYRNPYSGYDSSPYRYQSAFAPTRASVYATPTYGYTMPSTAAPVVGVRRSAVSAARPSARVDPSNSNVVLRPGMVLSDGATVISVDPIK